MVSIEETYFVELKLNRDEIRELKELLKFVREISGDIVNSRQDPLDQYGTHSNVAQKFLDVLEEKK